MWQAIPRAAPHQLVQLVVHAIANRFFFCRLGESTITDGESWKVTLEMRVRFGEEVQVGLWSGQLSKSDYLFTFERFKPEP